MTDIEHLNPGLAGLGRYEYGWSDADSAGATARRGLNEDVVRNISALKNEPQWMLDLRLKSLRLFDRKPMPSWGSDLTGIDFQNIKYFVRSTEKQATTWDELPSDIKNTYDRLGIPEAEKQRLIAGVAAQYECLAQDSRVWTADRGLVPIKEIEPGDRVFAFDETAGRFVVAPVRAAAQTGTKQTYAVTVGTRTIRATENHPFLVLEEGARVWRTVAELRVGSMVATATWLDRQPETAVTSPASKGSAAVLERVEITAHSVLMSFSPIDAIAAYGIEPVWDLEVDGPHNFVAEGVIVHNSEVVYHQIREDLEEKGVIFVDTDTGLREHADIFKEYFTSVIPAGDNKFASLNTAVWSGGSFIYVPPGVKVDIPLQAYFRINTENMGQFERTLIIADEGSYVHYVEGCLPAGELVADADGTHRPIETIRVGDRVLTHEGRPARVSAIQVRDYDGPMHTFTPLSPGNAFRVTSEHPLLVVPRADVTVKRAPRHGWLPEVDSSRLIGAQPQWRPAKDVQVGDFLVYPKPRFAPAKTTLPFDFARLAGYYLAEGHTTLTNGAESVVFSFHIDELAYVDELQHIFKELYDVSGSVRLDETKHEARLLVYSKAAYHALRIHCGTGSADKRLSADLIGQDELFLRALVDAYVNGDGSVARRGGSKQATWVRAHTVSRVWAMQLQAIMARLGTFATMELRRPGGPGSILGRDVVRRDLWQVQWTERDGEAVGPRQVRDAGDYYLVPVKRREDAAYRAPVFNLDVEAPDSYLAQGFAVHNCTAPIYKSDSLHSAVVEIVVKKDARVRYTTIQNWSNNVYNLVTKRATCAEGATMEWIDGNIGSKVTMKYPAVYLLGRHARGETLSIAFAGEGQHQDAGAKMVHAAPDTSSSIISKSVARGGGRTSYRGLIQIQEGATGSKSTVRCDALLVDTISRSDTYPYVDVREDDVQMGHEATVSKVSEDQLFYLMSRGMTEEEAMAMIVRGFVEPIARELPMEYALELNRLIELQMEGAVG